MIVTSHAINQFRKRSGSQSDDDGIEKTILHMFKGAKPYEPPIGYRTASLINHGFSATSYFMLERWVFIVCNEKIVTVYEACVGENKWKKRVKK